MLKRLFELFVPNVTTKHLLLVLLLVRALVLWSDIAMAGLLVKDQKRSVADHSCRRIKGDDGAGVSWREIGLKVTGVLGGVGFEYWVAEGCCCC